MVRREKQQILKVWYSEYDTADTQSEQSIFWRWSAARKQGQPLEARSVVQSWPRLFRPCSWSIVSSAGSVGWWRRFWSVRSPAGIGRAGAGCSWVRTGFAGWGLEVPPSQSTLCCFLLGVSLLFYWKPFWNKEGRNNLGKQVFSDNGTSFCFLSMEGSGRNM